MCKNDNISSKVDVAFSSMDSIPLLRSLLLVLIAGAPQAVFSDTTFILHNNCKYTVWPGTLCGNGAAVLGGGGLELPASTNASFSAPPGWSGRFWARTGCIFPDNATSGSCVTGDCSGGLRCTMGGKPPVTLAEFTLADNAGGKDFFDVSLVDGYNVGMGIRPSSVSGSQAGSNCRYAGCVADVNGRCPAELRVSGDSGETVACRSACATFGSPEYCCTGAHASPTTCGPTRYSQLFKSACPAAYSYAYDDATSTFTCAAGVNDYLITFCPSSADAEDMS